MVWIKRAHWALTTGGVANRGGKVGERPPGKINVKTGTLSPKILIFVILVFSWLLFFCVFLGVFVFLAGLDIHNIRVHYHGPPSASFFPLAQTSSYATAYNLIMIPFVWTDIYIFL